MFIDQEQKKEIANPQSPPPIDYAPRNKPTVYIIAASAVVLLLVGLSFYYFFLRAAKNNILTVDDSKILKTASSTDRPGGLPSELGAFGGDDSIFGSSTENLKAEDISFGYFYKKNKDDFKPNINNYVLPVNIKADAVNYYDASRKIDFDKYVSELNNSGFAVLDNKINQEYKDFFNMYRYLINKELPVAITSDFIIYYYQNIFKNVYKEMEKNIFYENVWDINNQLYTIALTKYKRRLVEVGPINDTILEAQRLETAYFAVALKLLSPDPDQIQSGAGANAIDKFSAEESAKYEFSVPDYLQADVLKEVGLIKTGKNTAKSPVFLYSKNYTYYAIPANYKSNAKLNNFYLALKWLNSIFPLYYRSTKCPSCLLDYNDWMINMAAAGSLAKDFSENQDLKNRWAVIYKFISFFSGLRQDLTYLHYNEALSDLFGQDYNLENIFSQQNKNREPDLARLQEKLFEFKFSPLEGEINRANIELKHSIGMRMLEEPYWPNDFIFANLTGEELTPKDTQAIKNNSQTACQSKLKGVSSYRCNGFGLDIVNLLSPVSQENKYFFENTNFENYTNRVDDLRLKISKFDQYSWNNNIYWLNLDLSRLLLDSNKALLPVFANSGEWQTIKNYNTVLGAWANLHLPEDKYSNYVEERGSLSGPAAECNTYNYVEPRLELFSDLAARNEMLIKMLTMLKVAEKTNAVSIELKELGQKLEKLLSITKKELSDISLDSDDCIFIKDFTTHSIIENGSSKNYTFDFKDKKLQVSTQGVKLLVVVNQFNDKKALVFGPVFNYSEK